MSDWKLVIGLFIGLLFGTSITGVLAQNNANERPEVVMPEGLAPTRAASNGNAQITPYAEGDKAVMGVLRLKPGAEIPEHEDESEEYLYVLQGTGTITVDGTDYDVEPNTGIYLPAGATVTYNNGDGVFKAVQFFAPPESANKYSEWETGQIRMKNKARGAGRSSGGQSGDGGGEMELE